MQRNGKWIMLTMLGLTTGTNVVWAQRLSGQGALAASNKGTYSMTSATGIVAATKTTYFSMGSEELLVDWFSVRITWNSSYVSLSSYHVPLKSGGRAHPHPGASPPLKT